MAKVSVIVVNYNGKGIVEECLEALRNQTFTDFDIIVVDNASSDGSVSDIRKFSEKILPASLKLVECGRNTGFTGGNIEGLKHAAGEYIALLNNDTVAVASYLRELVESMDRNPDVGICAARMLVAGTDLIDSAGDGFSSNMKGFKRGEDMSSSAYDRAEYVFGACAGAALYRRSMLEEIGFLDDDFFLIYEDTDLNLRAQLAGWKVMYVPSAVVQHKVRSTIGYMSDTAVYYSLRNSELTRIKNIPSGVFIRCLPAYILGTLLEFIFFAVRHGRMKLYVKAKLDAIRLLPKMLLKRKIILAGRNVSNTYLLGIMTPVLSRAFFRAKGRKFLHG